MEMILGAIAFIGGMGAFAALNAHSKRKKEQTN